jgi:hypothetical protein
MKKAYVCSFLLFNGIFVGNFSCFGMPDKCTRSSHVHVTRQTKEDQNLLSKMRPLFLNTRFNPSVAQKRVKETAIKEYGAREVNFLNNEQQKILGLFFERKNAPVNIVYVTGFSYPNAPTKEWAAPISQVFPDFNILLFDWRGRGESEGENGLFKKDFGANAYPDIQAAIDFVKKQNNKPIVLHGFCLGGAISLKAVLEAKKNGDILPDAICLSSPFTYFENIFSRAHNEVNVFYRPFIKLCIKFGVGRKFLDFILNGSLFNINPAEMICKIDIPVWIDHATQDKLSITQEVEKLYEERQNGFLNTTLFESELGKHVRVHSTVPAQYKKAYVVFLRKAGFLKEQEEDC